MSGHDVRLIPIRGNPLGTRYRVRCVSCGYDLHAGDLTYEAAKDAARAHVGRVAG